MTIFNSHLKRLILMHRYHRFLVQGDNKLTKSLLSLFYLTRFPHLAHLQHFYFNISTSFPGPKHERSLVVYCVINTFGKLDDSNLFHRSKLFRQIAIYHDSNAVRISTSKPFSSPNKKTHTYIQASSRISSIFTKP